MKPTLLVIDMQKIFARQWHVFDIEKVIENTKKLCRAFGSDAIFTRHIQDTRAQGTWKAYNREFSYLENDRSNWALFDELLPFAKTVLTKSTYSCFKAREFKKIIEKRRVESVIIAGVEAQFCVLGAIMDAVDAGISVTVASDAVGDEKDGQTQEVLKICRRMPCQVSLKTTDEIIKDLR